MRDLLFSSRSSVADAVPLLTGPLDRQRWCDWAADGTKLAVVSDIDGKSAITVTKTDGSGSHVVPLDDMERGRQLLDHAEPNWLALTCSPDVARPGGITIHGGVVFERMGEDGAD